MVFLPLRLGLFGINDLKIEANISPFALGDVGGQQISLPRKFEGRIEKLLIQKNAVLKELNKNLDFSSAIHPFLAGEGPADVISKFKSILL